MTETPGPIPPAELLAHAGFLRGLARALVRGQAKPARRTVQPIARMFLIQDLLTYPPATPPLLGR